MPTRQRKRDGNHSRVPLDSSRPTIATAAAQSLSVKRKGWQICANSHRPPILPPGTTKSAVARRRSGCRLPSAEPEQPSPDFGRGTQFGGGARICDPSLAHDMNPVGNTHGQAEILLD